MDVQNETAYTKNGNEIDRTTFVKLKAREKKTLLKIHNNKKKTVRRINEINPS